MNTVTKIFILLSLALSIELGAQEDKFNFTAFYGDVLLNAVDADHRDYAEGEFYEIIITALQNKSIDSISFESIPWVYKLVPQDSSFILLSWKVELSDRISRYRNFIVFNDGSYHEFNDGGNVLLEDGEYIINTPKECLSALYYKIQSNYNSDNEVDSYLLYGFRTFDQYENIKVLEVLDLSTGKPRLGKSIFIGKDERGYEDIKNRLILKYALDSQVSFQYNPNTKMIIYDHLIPRMGRLEGQGPTLLPDGSYEAYFYDRGRWIYKEKLFDQVQEEPPIPNPVLDKRPKDIFGKGN